MLIQIHLLVLIWSFESGILSLNSRPFVSNGKSNTHTPERKITIWNSKIDAVWWHPCTKPTATRGQIIPPILPIELAIPTPVVRIEVGYICSSNQTNKDQNPGTISKWFSWTQIQTTRRIIMWIFKQCSSQNDFLDAKQSESSNNVHLVLMLMNVMENFALNESAD